MNKERSEIPSKAFQLSKTCQADELLDRFVFYSFRLCNNTKELPFELVIPFCPDKQKQKKITQKKNKLTVKLCNFTQNANGNSKCLF